jgi:hypothetical protein
MQTEQGSLNIPDGVVRPKRFVVGAKADGLQDTIAALPGPEMVYIEIGYPLPYPVRTIAGPRAFMAGGGVPWRLALGDGAEPTIHVFGEGLQKEMEVSWGMRRPRVPPSAVQALRAHWVENRVSGGGMNRAEAERRTGMLPDPDMYPIFDDLLVDRTGSIWARLATELWGNRPTPWLVFDPRGRWLGEVLVPNSVAEVLKVTEDRLIGLRVDQFGVEQVAVHALSR